MKAYRIEVKPLVEFEKLDFDDQDYFGSLSDDFNNPDKSCYVFDNYFGETKDQALCVFHLDVPIAVLEDFEISIEEQSNE